MYHKPSGSTSSLDIVSSTLGWVVRFWSSWEEDENVGELTGLGSLGRYELNRYSVG